MELVMVLLVLTFLATALVPQISGFGVADKSAETITTEATMRSIRNAIMGTDGRPGAWADLGQRDGFFIKQVEFLLLAANDPGFSLVQAAHPGIQAFDPVTQIGWRGPYLATGRAGIVDAWGRTLVIEDLDGDEQNIRLRSFGPDLDDNSDDVTLMLRGTDG